MASFIPPPPNRKRKGGGDEEDLAGADDADDANLNKVCADKYTMQTKNAMAAMSEREIRGAIYQIFNALLQRILY
jgi:ATP-dependent RNA helicase A